MEKRKINSGLVFDFAFKGSLCEAAREPNQSSSDLCDSAGSYIRGGSAACFLAADGRSVALYGAESAPYRARGESRGRTEGQLSLTPLRGELPQRGRQNLW